MRLGMVGLGRMGMNMARRLLEAGHQVVAWNRSPEKVDEIAAQGAEPARTLADLVAALDSGKDPCVVWVMLPAGEVTEAAVIELAGLLSPDDVLVEGGNSFYKDDIRRAEELKAKGIHYVDAGVSGGIWGLTEGYCTMVGGEKDVFERIEPIVKSLAPEGGYLYCGPTGAGHFVKMVHNGIEYGMMQAYAEGFSILEASPYGQHLDYAEVSRMWNKGSVIRSWLLELAEQAFDDSPCLTDLEAWVEDSGEGRWTVQQAVDMAVSAPVITLSLMQRFRSREPNSFGDRMLAALRQRFGGHAVKRRGED